QAATVDGADAPVRSAAAAIVEPRASATTARATAHRMRRWRAGGAPASLEDSTGAVGTTAGSVSSIVGGTSDIGVRVGGWLGTSVIGIPSAAADQAAHRGAAATRAGELLHELLHLGELLDQTVDVGECGAGARGDP